MKPSGNRAKTLLLLPTAAFALLLAGAQAPEKPSIIVIFTDDQGYADLGVQGAVKDIRTPHLDRLAQEGVRATAGYITAPQCVPSRAGLLTGRYQQRFGVDHNGLGPLPPEEATLANRLRKAGYVTGMIGKWHLDPNPSCADWIKANLPDAPSRPRSPVRIPRELTLKYLPENRGFSEYFCGSLTNYRANYTLDGKDMPPGWIRDDRFRLDVQSDAAVAFIDRNRSKPFFLYLAYFAPHVPLEATEEYLKRFPGEMPTRRRYGLAMMSAIDDGVGRIAESLRRHGIDEKTVVFFISDNGAPLKIDKKDLPIEDKGGAWDGSLNDPWIGEKGMLTEGGIRVPFLVRWKGRLPAGRVYDRPVLSLDVAATAVALAGLPADGLDGVDLVPYLSGEKKGDPHEALYWRFWSQAAVRSGRWKYLRLGGNREFLFDLEGGAHDSKNLLKDHPDTARELRGKLEAWCGGLKEPGLPDRPLNPQETEWYAHYLGLKP